MQMLYQDIPRCMGDSPLTGMNIQEGSRIENFISHMALVKRCQPLLAQCPQEPPKSWCYAAVMPVMPVMRYRCGLDFQCILWVCGYFASKCMANHANMERNRVPHILQ